MMLGAHRPEHAPQKWPSPYFFAHNKNGFTKILNLGGQRGNNITANHNETRITVLIVLVH